ncbi:MAG: hypothetical protein N3F67_02620 [Acidilobaceae archaeon]|nr:hypothetical protein [Acidilobaceae archaeon]
MPKASLPAVLPKIPKGSKNPLIAAPVGQTKVKASFWKRKAG